MEFVGWIVMGMGGVVFVVLFLRVHGDRRVVKARDISGQVVMGDVGGDVTQHRADTKPGANGRPFRIVSWMNPILAIVASLLVIVGAVLGLGGSP